MQSPDLAEAVAKEANSGHFSAAETRFSLQ
jgi:hypothetical protein